MATVIANNVDVILRGAWAKKEWPNAHTVPHTTVLNALAANGIDPKFARPLKWGDAFVRAIRATVRARAEAAKIANPDDTVMMREMPAKGTEISFQFTAEFPDATGKLSYSASAIVTLDKASGTVTATKTDANGVQVTDTQLADDVTNAIPQFIARRTRDDINRIMDDVYRAFVGPIIRLHGGTDFYPNNDVFYVVNPMETLRKIQAAVVACGGWVTRFRETAEVAHGTNAPVPQAPTGKPKPTALPSSPLPPSADELAKLATDTLLGELFAIEADILEFLKTSYKHDGRKRHAEECRRDKVKNAMAQIETMGKVGILGSYWEKLNDWCAGLDYLIDNGVTVPSAPTQDVFVSRPTVDSETFTGELFADTTPLPTVEMDDISDLPKLPQELAVDAGLIPALPGMVDARGNRAPITPLPYAGYVDYVMKVNSIVV